MVGNHDRVATTSWSPNSELIDPAVLVDAEVGTLLLLPDKIDDQGHALYRDDNAGLVKTVCQRGARMEFAWPRESRVYLSEFSAGEIIANIALGVIGNFTTDTIKYAIYAIRLRIAAALGRTLSGDLAGDDAIKVKIARFESSSDRRIIEGLECIGPANGVIQVIESLANPTRHINAEGDSDDRSN